MNPTQKNFRREVKEAEESRKLKGKYGEYKKSAGQFDYDFNTRNKSAFYETSKDGKRVSIWKYLFIGWNIFVIFTWIYPSYKNKINTSQIDLIPKTELQKVFKPIEIKDTSTSEDIIEAIKIIREYTVEYMNKQKDIPITKLVNSVQELEQMKQTENDIDILNILNHEIDFLIYLIENHNIPFTEEDNIIVSNFNDKHKELVDIMNNR